jgi:selenide,water dikinase
LGTVHPDNVKRNSTAVAGDVLVLGKPLGVGILSAALKKDQLDATGYRAMIETTTRLNRPGAELARLPGVHAMTDVTGFGLLGHLLEMCRGARLGAQVRMSSVPLLDEVLELADRGVITGASGRNWASYGEEVQLAPDVSRAQQALLCDPQTSGGLLVACSEAAAGDVIAAFQRGGFERAAIIGKMVAGVPAVSVVS